MFDKKSIIIGKQPYYVTSNNEREVDDHPHVVVLSNIEVSGICFAFKIQSFRRTQPKYNDFIQQIENGSAFIIEERVQHPSLLINGELYPISEDMEYRQLNDEITDVDYFKSLLLLRRNHDLMEFNYLKCYCEKEIFNSIQLEEVQDYILDSNSDYNILSKNEYIYNSDYDYERIFITLNNFNVSNEHFDYNDEYFINNIKLQTIQNKQLNENKGMKM